VRRTDLAHIIGARIEEVFSLVLQEIKRSGYDGLLPAGMVLTGGTSLLPGIANAASRVLNLPVRVARPENLVGLIDKLDSPAYSTTVGLLHWAVLMNEFGPARLNGRRRYPGGDTSWEKLKDILSRFVP
jgi:cell division protein FtsA